VDWIGVAQNREMRGALVNAVMSLRVPQNGGKFWTAYTTGGLSSSVKLNTHTLVIQKVAIGLY
jgi:hypothetical protein